MSIGESGARRLNDSYSAFGRMIVSREKSLSERNPPNRSGTQRLPVVAPRAATRFRLSPQTVVFFSSRDLCAQGH